MTPETKLCKDCQETKPADEFYLQSGRWLSPYCKPCSRVRVRQHAKDNLEQYRLNGIRWRANHPFAGRSRKAVTRAIGRGCEVHDVDIEKVFQEAEGVCGICGLWIDPHKWNIDHITPLIAGGPHHRDNVQVVHPRCNALKAHRTDWSIYATAAS